MKIADELREMAAWLREMADVPAADALDVIATRCEGMVSLAQVEKAFAAMRATLADPDKEWTEEGKEGAEWVMLTLIPLMQRLKGGR